MLLITAYDPERYILAIQKLRAYGDPTYTGLRDAKAAIDRLRDHGEPIRLTTDRPLGWRTAEVFTLAPVPEPAPLRATVSRDAALRFVVDVLALTDADTAQEILQTDSWEALKKALLDA